MRSQSKPAVPALRHRKPGPAATNVRRSVLFTIAVATAAAAITACGSSSGPMSSASSSYAQGIKYADCMRSHGVPNFPDPNAQGEIQGNFNLQSPQAQAAQNECQKFAHRPLSPAQQQALETGALVFSVCMRAHGVPDFPDPQKTAGGVGIKVDDTPGSDLNPDSPAFQKASKACHDDLLHASSAAGLPPPPGG